MRASISLKGHVILDQSEAVVSVSGIHGHRDIRSVLGRVSLERDNSIEHCVNMIRLMF